jgi:hypothetical protein
LRTLLELRAFNNIYILFIFKEKLIKESEARRADFFALKNGFPAKTQYGKVTKSSLILQSQKNLIAERITLNDFLIEIASLTNKVIDTNFIDDSDIESDNEYDNESDLRSIIDFFAQDQSSPDLDAESPQRNSNQSFALVTPSQKRKSLNELRTPIRKTPMRQRNLRNNF